MAGGFFDLAQATYTQLAIPTELVPSIPAPSSGMRITVYGRTGARLADIRPDVHSVSWKLNKKGLCRFSMPYTDSKCTASILRAGNYVLIEFDNGLPDWAGVMAHPLGRDAFGVHVTAYTGEELLDWRTSGSAWGFEGQAPGSIFEQAIRDANRTWPTGIAVGNINAGGDAQTQMWHYQNLLRRIQELARLSNEDFHVGHLVESGRISFYGHWYGTRGQDRTNAVLLTEGANVEDARLDEQGPIANVVRIVGGGASWDERPVGIAMDASSVAKYGYREHIEQMATSDQDTLTTMAEALLEQMAEPRHMIALEVTNDPPGEFGDYRVGDIVDTYLFIRGGDDWVFDSPVRVVARSWTPAGTCELEVEEWSG